LTVTEKHLLMMFLLKILTSSDEINLKEEWLALDHDFTIEEKQNLSTLNFNNM